MGREVFSFYLTPQYFHFKFSLKKIQKVYQGKIFSTSDSTLLLKRNYVNRPRFLSKDKAQPQHRHTKKAADRRTIPLVCEMFAAEKWEKLGQTK